MSTSTRTIREIVSKHPSAAAILNRFDIDLCLQGDLSLEMACRELQLSVDQVLEKLGDAESRESGNVEVDPTTLSLGRLIQHIVRAHHHCVRQELPRLVELASRVGTKRSERAPELAKIPGLIERLHAEKYAHIQKEEQVLFPFILQMEDESVGAYSPVQSRFRAVSHPILMMEQEHESVDHTMAEIAHLTNDFEPPAWACATHIALFSGLCEFESDLKQHLHLENCVLFPRAIQLEESLEGRS